MLLQLASVLLHVQQRVVLELTKTAHCPESPPALGSPIIATVNSRCSEGGTSACCFVPAAAAAVLWVVAAAELYRSAEMRVQQRCKVIEGITTTEPSTQIVYVEYRSPWVDVRQCEPACIVIKVLVADTTTLLPFGGLAVPTHDSVLGSKPCVTM
jgi:hypothetical protein